MILVAMLSGCVEAKADPPVQWEYAWLEVFQQDTYVTMKSDPEGAVTGLGTISPKMEHATHFRTELEALNAAGAQGWEIVDLKSEGTCLAKRRK